MPGGASRARYSIISYSELGVNPDARIDGEYWHPDFIRNSRLVSPENLLRDFIDPDTANIKTTPIYRDFEYLEISKISLNNLAYETTPVAVGEEPDRAHHILEKGDVVVSTVRPNRNAVALIEQEGIIGSSGLAVLRAKGIAPEYLFAFCKTNYFIQCLVRANKASMYPAVAAKDILDTPLFLASKPFRERIVEIIGNALSGVSESKGMYAAAQATLLAELGLADWRPRLQSTFVRNFADLGQAGRMDSDYFQPKYGEIVDAIKGYAGGWSTLGELVTLRKGIEVGSGEYRDAGIPFVRVSNLSPFEITEEKYISESLYSEIAQHQPQQGEILLTKDATPGIAYYLSEPPPPLIPSGGILRLRSKTDRLNNECLTLLLNSLLTKEQANRDAGGSVIMHWRPEQIEQVVIPIIAPERQGEIRERVAESAALRRQSRRLLELAKGAVELAIERDEAVALGWLAGEVGE